MNVQKTLHAILDSDKLKVGGIYKFISNVDWDFNSTDRQPSACI